jgi:DNA-binding MarR family transcriptional regulator
MKKMPDADKARFALDKSHTYRLHALHKLSDRQTQAAYLSETGLALGEARCLAALGAFEPLSVVDLGRRANLDKGQASRGAQSLVDKGLATKTAHASDGRGVTLALSTAGRATWRRVAKLIERRNAEIFGCLSAAELDQLGSMLDRLIVAAEEKMSTKM